MLLTRYVEVTRKWMRCASTWGITRGWQELHTGVLGAWLVCHSPISYIALGCFFLLLTCLRWINSISTLVCVNWVSSLCEVPKVTEGWIWEYGSHCGPERTSFDSVWWSWVQGVNESESCYREPRVQVFRKPEELEGLTLFVLWLDEKATARTSEERWSGVRRSSHSMWSGQLNRNVRTQALLFRIQACLSRETLYQKSILKGWKTPRIRLSSSIWSVSHTTFSPPSLPRLTPWKMGGWVTQPSLVWPSAVSWGGAGEELKDFSAPSRLHAGSLE